MSEPTKTEVIVSKLKNHRVLSYVIAAAIIFLGIVAFAEGVSKAGKLWGEAVASEKYDSETAEAIISTARKVDGFLLGDTPNFNSPEIRKRYLEIKADLNSLLMRNRVRPYNDISTKSIQSAIENWDLAKELFQDDLHPDAQSIVRELMFQQFEAILRIEESKRQ